MTGTIAIGHIQRDQGIRVDRTTALGNPFRISQTATREQVIEQYRVWLRHQLQSDTPARRYLYALCRQLRQQNITLCCWCVPALRRPLLKGEACPPDTQACHADVIASAMLWVIREGLDQVGEKQLTAREYAALRCQARAEARQAAAERAIETGEELDDLVTEAAVEARLLGIPQPYQPIASAGEVLRATWARLRRRRAG